MTITFATFIISEFAKNSSLDHLNAFNQILYYLAEIFKKNIIFERKK